MILIIHGYEGSSEGHFQHWLAGVLREEGAKVSFPDLPSPTAPVLDEWVSAIADVIAARDEAVTIVAHSLGCWAVDHYIARRGTLGIHAVLMVAPPSPYSLFEPIQGFLPPPRATASWAPIAATSLILGSDDDAYADEDEFIELSTQLGVPHRILQGAGHINADAGFGPFPLALTWLRDVGAVGAPPSG
jgi:uncharacterized protein